MNLPYLVVYSIQMIHDIDPFHLMCNTHSDWSNDIYKKKKQKKNREYYLRTYSWKP